MPERTTNKSVPKSTPKDVFLNLLLFVSLYASAVTAMALLFQYINLWFPQPQTDYYVSIINTIRYSASFLIVTFPVYIFLTWLNMRDFAADPARREIRIRKWLIYLTLFVAALTVMGDLVTLVYNLLSGEFTVRFILKVAVVLLVSGKVFAFYFYDLHHRIKNFKLLAWLGSIGVLAVIVVGFILAGSPAHQRALKFDEQRVADLQNIQSQVTTYWQKKSQLPSTLADLTDSISGYKAQVDPETSAAYEYQVQSATSFQLCANFDLPSENTCPQAVPMLAPGSDNWDHGAGRVCFNRNIDPQLYAPVQPPTK